MGATEKSDGSLMDLQAIRNELLPAFVFFPSQSGVVTFDPLWFPGHRVASNLQLSVSRQRFEAKVKG